MSRAVFVMCCCGLARAACAGLIVSPQVASGESTRTAAVPTQPGTGSTSQDQRTTPGSFGGGGSFTFGPSNGNLAIGAANHNADFFFQLPAGVVNRVRLHGGASSRAEVGTANATSGMGVSEAMVSFTVVEPVLYHLVGTTQVNAAAGSGNGAGMVVGRVRFSQFVIPIHDFSLSSFAVASVPFDFSGELAPGSYTLSAYATSSSIAMSPAGAWSSNVSYDATMTFTAIPSPGALGLLVLAGAMGARRRRQE